MATSADGGTSVFKRAQQRHRRQGASPNRIDDLTELADFSNPREDDRIFEVEAIEPIHPEQYIGPLYGISSAPDFLYAPQALSESVQMELAYLSVSQYCDKPHRTNIDLMPPREHVEENNTDDSMWELWKQQNVSSSVTRNDDKSRKNRNGKQKKKKKYRSFDKLSWSTMGYHYDWTARAYREEAKSPVPQYLARLASSFALTSLWHTNPSSKPSALKFTSSACIVNFYHCKSIMGGHQDDLEYALDKPVVSMSLGLAAVFLLGGQSKQDPVVPILVRPGDVMMMGGKSRLCFHGMARVIPAAVPIPSVSKEFTLTNNECTSSEDRQNVSPRNDAAMSTCLVPDSEREALAVYLSQHRVNINVRQVLPDGVSETPQQDGKQH